MTEWFGEEGDIFKSTFLLSIKIYLVHKTLKEKYVTLKNKKCKQVM